MKEFWNERYGLSAYAYGEEPNLFFRDELSKLNPGVLFLPAEGEGRNAVYAARMGWKVKAQDWSEAGKKKALDLAAKHGVGIDYAVGDLNDLELEGQSLDAAGLIYVHLPEILRRTVHRKIMEALKPGGVVILEAFNKKHLEYNSKNAQVGGPKQMELLYSAEEIREDFAGMKIQTLEERTVDLMEGNCHCGTGAVVRFVGQKPLA